MINRLEFLSSNKCEWLSEYTDSIFEKHNIVGAFNPSFDLGSGVLSFRGLEDNVMSSYVYVNSSIFNLSKDLSGKLGCKQLIDPKVFTIKDETYVTFNSGYVKGGNELYVIKVFPEIGNPKKIIYKGRKDQERNWAFFFNDGEMYALYWINPMKILKLDSKTESTWTFVDYFSDVDNNLPFDITIGTQLESFQNKYYFVGHRKVIRDKKKIYLGKIGVFDFINKSVDYEGYWVSHSLDSLYGEEPKSNKNLLSCTYFSGIQRVKEGFILGYGINDLKCGFSTKNIILDKSDYSPARILPSNITREGKKNERKRR